MGNEYIVQIDDQDVERKLKQLKGIRNGAPKAMMRAFNRTVAGMKADAVEEVTKRYTVSPQREIRGRLETSKATLANLSVVLHSKGRPVRSVKFQHRANRKPGRKGTSPVFLRNIKGGSGGKLTGGSRTSSAFMATMPNGMRGIFQRTGEIVNQKSIRTGKSASRYDRREKRENIEQVHSPGVMQMLNNPKVREAIPKKAEARFNKALDHEIDYLLKS